MANVYDTSDLRKGLKIMMEGAPYIVIEAQFVKPGKGAAFTRTKMKNLLTGGVLERNIRSGEKIDAADIEERDFVFLYKEGDDAFVFMDQATYDQVTLSKEVVDDSWKYLKENFVCRIMFYNGRPVSLDPPTFVVLRVQQTDPGMRGDTATNASKPATLESGASIQVPLFVNENDLLKIDTRTGQYVERVRA